MREDFSALDLLSCGGFRLSAVPPQKPVSMKLRFLMLRKPGAGPKRRLGSFLPLLGGKVGLPVSKRSLQGWPVPLSWPTKEIASRDFWFDQSDQLPS